MIVSIMLELNTISIYTEPRYFLVKRNGLVEETQWSRQQESKWY